MCIRDSYSIDEAFVDLSWLSGNELLEYANSIRKTVFQWTGIPISIGIAPTKTLAKIANRIAKKNLQYQGVFLYPESEAERDLILEGISVKDIWGIGRQYSKWLVKEGVNNALQLKQTPEWKIQPKMGIVGVLSLIHI